jgi:hypothetical protein
VIPVVVGSSPIGHPKNFNDFKPGDAGLFVSGRSTAITGHDPGITRDLQAWLA